MNTELTLKKVIDMVADVAECPTETITPDSSLPLHPLSTAFVLQKLEPICLCLKPTL